MPSRKKTIHALCVVMALAMLATGAFACGKKAPPKAPEGRAAVIAGR
jgi:predicted small lipoprotein YifL